MSRATLYTINLFLIAGVWLLNGVVGKILHLVPRHEQIVARILGPAYAGPLTVAIGIGEVLLAVWILSRRWERLNVLTQVGLISTMNVLETLLAPDLLLWGRWNLPFALLFCGFIVWNHQLARSN